MTERQKKVALWVGIIILILLLWLWFRRGLNRLGRGELGDFSFQLGDIIVNPPGGLEITLQTNAPANYYISGANCDCGCNSLTLEMPNLDFMLDGLNAYLRDNAYQNMVQLYELYGIDYTRYAANG